MTNKCPTAPNRRYGCGHLCFETEGTLDRLPDEIEMDPAEVRRKQPIPASAMPYGTPPGGLYDSGDRRMALDRAIEWAERSHAR